MVYINYSFSLLLFTPTSTAPPSDSLFMKAS
jgi:hypothetical protein